MSDLDPVEALKAARALEPPKRKERKPPATGLAARPNTEPGDYKGGQMTMRELHRLAASHTPAALNTLAKIMKEGKDVDKIKCAEILLARAWGNPVTPIEHSGAIEVAAGAREKLLGILERLGDIPRARVIDVTVTPVPTQVSEAKTTQEVQTTKEKIPETILRPPPRSPEDE